RESLLGEQGGTDEGEVGGIGRECLCQRGIDGRGTHPELEFRCAAALVVDLAGGAGLPRQQVPIGLVLGGGQGGYRLGGLALRPALGGVQRDRRGGDHAGGLLGDDGGRGEGAAGVMAAHAVA